MRVERLISRLLVVVLVALAAGCGDSPTSASATPGYSQTDVRPGTGTAAAASNLLTVEYTGWLYDATKTDHKGLQFETSRGNTTAFSFQLGFGQVITGWDQGLVGMQVGGLRRLVLPPSLAYGSIRNGPIPPNATLVFDIELTGLQ